MSIGETLSAARAAAGLTLQDVSERTRIRRTVVDRIEHDDFSLCGGDVYARGHLRTIATVVGLDPEPLLAEFAREHRAEGPSARQVFESETATAPERRGPNWTAAMAAALLVVAGLGVFQLVRGGSPDGTATGPPATSVGPQDSGSPTATTGTSPSPSPTVVAELPSSDGVTVRLTVVGPKSWVSATASGTTVFQGLLSKGETKTFTDPTLVKLVVGNAGAVTLVVNGRDLGAAGSSGEVVRVSFGPGDPAAAG
ncbi:MAG: DUF4115 domain-containing protein [Actinomycetia bacterium]|jgi:cytoskeletal protein RodZ|nr:DUF4115 domain-containing protein [Actinomycetes bacterium]